MSNDKLQSILMRPIFINDAMTGATVKRTWLERLFSWPWMPWQSTKFDSTAGKPFLGDGQVIQTPQGFIMNSRTKRELLRTLEYDERRSA